MNRAATETSLLRSGGNDTAANLGEDNMNGWAYFAIGVGILMIGQWIYYLLNGKAPEIRTEPVELGFHLLAEFVTAFTLIIGGIVLLIGHRWGLALYLLGIGAMLYSVTNSAGYFAQRKQWPMVGVFALLFVLGALAVLRVFALAA